MKQIYKISDSKKGKHQNITKQFLASKISQNILA